MPSGSPGYPAQAIDILVGFPPGGASDRLARAVAPALSERLETPVTVSNRSGDGGNPAARFVAGSPADGSTLLLGNNGLLAANPLLFPGIGYDVRRDFVPVTLIGVQPSILVLTPELPARTLAELLELASASPRGLVIATSGHGSAAHLASGLFRAMTRLELREKAYDGAASAIRDVAAGTVDMMFSTAASALGHIAEGRLRPLAVTTARPTPRLPGVPTMIELGMSGFEVTSWHGFAAPAGTPAELVATLGRAVRDILQEARVRAALDALAIDIVGGTSAEFSAHIAAEIPKWAEIIESARGEVRREA